MSCVVNATSYFRDKFDNNLKLAMSAFKSARYFDPMKAHELQPSCTDIDNLKLLPFFDNGVIIGLKSELPQYLAAVEDVCADTDKLHWWKCHESDFPFWSNACKTILLMQPSSAAAERVFSLLSNSFNDHQTSSLEDYIETSIMLKYNSR